MNSKVDSTLSFNTTGIGEATLLRIYRNLLRPRLIEEKMLLLLRQGKISKWFSGIGQEAISVGAAMAMFPEEYIFTLHRNLGVFTTRQVPLEQLYAQWQGKASGFTKGRDRSFHFGSMEHHIVGMISHLGSQLSLGAGVALSHQLAGEQRCVLAFTGEGATSEGEFHEALNVASVWQLPVIFVIENNGFGLSTPASEQYRCAQLAERGVGYGMRSLTIDGNNVLEVYRTISQLAAEIRQHPEPILLECMTFRIRGHEEASGTKYVPEELLNYWVQRDPVTRYEQFLIEAQLLAADQAATIRKEEKERIQEAVRAGDRAPGPMTTPEVELADTYAPLNTPATPAQKLPARELRFVDAISEGLRQAMEHQPNLVLMGQDIAEYGGVFKITDGFTEAFGKDRVRNTPLCESAIIGIGLGLSLCGYPAMVEMQFADFVACGFNQIVNNLAKLHYRWGQPANVVIRMPTGGGVGAGPFHSQSNEAWFFHTPGLRVVYPSNPHDAKGLLIRAFEDPNPVLFFEHKAIYRKLTNAVPEDYYSLEFGKAAWVRRGEGLSIITYGMGVHWALEAVETLDIDADIVDLRTLAPLDWEAVSATVTKNGKVLILHEDTLTGGVGGEISAYIAEHLFETLDAPVVRVASLDTPVPFADQLEANFLPQQRLRDRLKWLARY